MRGPSWSFWPSQDAAIWDTPGAGVPVLPPRPAASNLIIAGGQRCGSGEKVHGSEGTNVARTDLPSASDGAADRQALPESGDREVLERRLERLPPEHPASSIQDHHGRGIGETPEPGDRHQRNPDDATDHADARPLTDTEHADHVVKVRDLLGKAGTEGLATDSRFVTDPDKETWARERRVGHDAIINDIYDAAKDVPCERRAILAGGLPGAGKTTVLEHHAGVDRSQYLTINPDDIKRQMAERGMIPEVAGLTPMEASELVHEESSHIAKQLALRAMPDGKNVIWDITMSSQQSTEKRINDLRGFGYERVEGIFVDIPVETSIRRADGRHREDHDKYLAGQGLGGRYVAPEIIGSQEDPDWGSCNRKTFEQVKPGLDAWARYDNSVDGRAPQLADSSDTEEEAR
jgi:predicted kinase